MTTSSLKKKWEDRKPNYLNDEVIDICKQYFIKKENKRRYKSSFILMVFYLLKNIYYENLCSEHENYLWPVTSINNNHKNKEKGM